MNKKMKRDIKQIQDEIATILKELEALSNIDMSLPKVDVVAFDYKVLEQLQETAFKLSVDIDFFRETKDLAKEALTKAKDFNSLSTEEKQSILTFIKESYQKKELDLKADNLTHEKLVGVLTDFSRDIDKYIKKLEAKLGDLEVKIGEEEEKRENIRRDLLKAKLEKGSKALEELDQESLEFDRKIEHLKLLEEELELAIMEKENESQIVEVRQFLDEKIQ